MDERYRALFDYAPDGILIADAVGRYIDANPSICRMLGYAREELIGLDASAIVVPAEVKHIEPALEAIAGPKEYRREWRFRRKDGTAFPADVMATAMPDGNLLAIIRDVTARNALEAQFQQSQKMEALGHLAGGVAHDFNNLLTVILGSCDVILTGIGPEHPNRSDVEEVQAAGMRAAGLTRQLLAFSRKEVIEPVLLDLNAVLSSMRPMLRRLLKANVRIALTLAPDLARITADRGQIEQVVVNLAVNAQDAMPDGGTLTIATSNAIVAQGLHVVMTITDSGTGMSDEVKTHLFEPFFTTKAAGQGTGLGLATVHGIVTRGGGCVSVVSERGVGTVFTMSFPHAAPAGTPIEVLSSVASLPGGTELVLVVEDDPGLRELAGRVLERLGYGVLTAATPIDAMQLFDIHPGIDVLLTDVVMPGLSGPDLAELLRQRRPDLRVLFMSGYTRDIILQRGGSGAAPAFLHKPFTSEALATTLRALIDSDV